MTPGLLFVEPFDAWIERSSRGGLGIQHLAVALGAKASWYLALIGVGLVRMKVEEPNADRQER